jgi:transcriptional regulator with XRE-family HTH domain
VKDLQTSDSINSELESNIRKLCALRSITANQAFEASGVGRNFLIHLRNGSSPSIDKLLMLAKYFGVGIDTLIGIETDDSETKARMGKYTALMCKILDMAINSGIDLEGLTDAQFQLIQDQFEILAKCYKNVPRKGSAGNVEANELADVQFQLIQEQLGILAKYYRNAPGKGAGN